ncbi:hypothetical protein GCM10023143_11990 [Compostibacter hankyongensis]|uniref:RagB/SusD family nutrient uptake outer membrane protein n=2 Tax=Compostibacter hankyongensis TaxID=1007089 RepID=A0ABP8FKV3_9BACT
MPALLAFTAGCNKDYLKPRPLSFYTPENLYNTAEGLQSALVNSQQNLYAEYFADEAPFLTQMVLSDEAVNVLSTTCQNFNVLLQPEAPLNNTNYIKTGWFWDYGYKGIKLANTVISYIDVPKWDTTSAEDMATRNTLLGKAYFERALRYYWLCNTYGDVPWAGKLYTTPKLDFYSVKREVILEKIKEDLEWAAEWVPEKADKGDVPKGAILHLLTKVYLALGDFDNAIRTASLVIDGGTYHLMTERFGADKDDPSKNLLWDLHRPENKALPENKEALYLLIDRPNVPGNSGGSNLMRNTVPAYFDPDVRTPNGNQGMAPITDIEFDMMAKYGRGIGRYRPTWYLEHTIWDNDASDLRHTRGNWTFMDDLVYDNPALKGVDPYYGKPLQKYNATGTLLIGDTMRKWYSWPHHKLYIIDPEVLQSESGGHGDWYIFRLAETYLLRAEAYWWKGNLGAAAKDINAVRVRAQAKPIAPDAVNIETILDERARELCYEEPRKEVLTRIAYLFAKTGKPYKNKVYTLENFSSQNFWYDWVIEKGNYYNTGKVTIVHGDPFTISPYHVLWPVPQHAIDANVNGVINQNQGYIGDGKSVPPLDALPEE